VTGPSKIRILAPEVAARIAAGEVIERPVSVVRELLDNAIDAGATRIDVSIEEGGLKLIQVTDNGRGISPEDLEVAFERHATSKISAVDDLVHVHTLGFRGEALPSIAAAADLEITTRAVGEPIGSHAVLVDARVVRRVGRPGPCGTSLAVRDLFARLPARRKFIGSQAGETRQVTLLVSHYALAYPKIAFSLSSGERTSIRTPGDGDPRHAFAAVYGAAIAGEMLDVSHGEEGVTVEGLTGPPSLHRGSRGAISIFVNGRWVQSRPLLFAVTDAYHSQLPVGRYPIAALSLGLADEDVDVNVHPAKAEVRFRDDRLVGRAVRHAVAVALEAAGPVSWLPRPAVGADNGDSPGGAATLRARLEPPQALRPPEPLQSRMDLPRSPGGVSHRSTLPLLRVVGQLASAYVIGEGPDGMYLVDQHAAHERVVYDRLLARPSGEPSVQPLLEPILLELEPAAAAAAEEFAAHLTRLGLRLEPFGDRAYLLRAVPLTLSTDDAAASVKALLEQLGSDARVSDPFARAAATVACHGSVRAGMALATEEMRRLLEDLEAAESPRTCPHGRPTLVHVGTELIERQFGRR
jgi:DNA mismatch repair protein MutL